MPENLIRCHHFVFIIVLADIIPMTTSTEARRRTRLDVSVPSAEKRSTMPSVLVLASTVQRFNRSQARVDMSQAFQPIVAMTRRKELLEFGREIGSGLVGRIDAQR